MRDEDFEVFIDEFGEATRRIDAPAEAIQKWRGTLPDLLLTYWQEEGSCGYANGLFWFGIRFRKCCGSPALDEHGCVRTRRDGSRRGTGE